MSQHGIKGLMNETREILMSHYDDYCAWVYNNPEKSSTFESMFKWASYLLSGKISPSHDLTELVYSLSNILVLFNDVSYSRVNPSSEPAYGNNIKTWLTVIEYCEVCFELSAKYKWGSRGKWRVIALIQFIKCLGRLSLLRRREGLIAHPPLAPINRAQPVESVEDDETTNTVMILKSGVVVRKVENSPAWRMRTWMPPDLTANKDMPMEGPMVFAEALYVIKPLIHLSMLRAFGNQNWWPWFVSFSCDVTSNTIMRCHTSQRPLSSEQRCQLFLRHLKLLMYFVRSPFFEDHSKLYILKVFRAFGSVLPCFRWVFSYCIQHIPEWQRIYFYMWAH